MKRYYFSVSVFPDKTMEVSRLFKTMREAAGHAASLNKSEPKADHYVMYSETEEEEGDKIMGYESKIIVVDRRECEDKNGHSTWIYGDELARFDLCKMGYDCFDGVLFRELFTVPVDFDLYVNNEESDKTYPPEYWREDMYGEHCKYTTDINRVISWLEQSEQHNHYRRAALFLDFLRVLRTHTEEYAQICLVHYGY